MDIINRVLMDNVPVTVSTGLCEDGCNLIIDWYLFGIIFVSILIGIGNVYCVYRQKQRQRRINQNNEHLPRCEDIIMNLSDTISIKQIEIRCDVYLFLTPKARLACITGVDSYAVPTIEINKPPDQIFSSIEKRELICYCDGSYSHSMQIGYSGFRASNGAYRVCFLSPDDSRSGSTHTEVLAACLAIQYALEKHYDTLIIYTDNSKVEQLLKRPKKKDNINYSYICQILNQYQEDKGNNPIQVRRVRGHTSICEQQKCKTKYEFAKIDRIVRKKMRQYIRRWWIHFEQNYYYSYYKPVYHSYCTWRVLGYYA